MVAIDLNVAEAIFPATFRAIAQDVCDQHAGLLSIGNIIARLMLTISLGISAAAKWARDKFGIPEAEDGEEELAASALPEPGATKPKEGRPLPPLKPKQAKGLTS